MKKYAVAETILNGFLGLMLLSEKEHGNFFGYNVLYSSDNQDECEKYIASHTISKEINTIIIGTTTWCRQDDGLWRNEYAHSWAINYGNPDDEDIRNDYEMWKEVAYYRNCDRFVDLRQ